MQGKVRRDYLPGGVNVAGGCYSGAEKGIVGRCRQDKADVNRVDRDKADNLSSNTENTENIQLQQ